jgi:hypothetical protein
MRLKKTILLATLAGSGLLTAISFGRVYWRIGFADQSSDLTLLLGGQTIYQTNVKINSGSGRLCVSAIPGSYSAAKRVLSRWGDSQAGNARAHFGSQAGSGEFIAGGQSTRWLLLAQEPNDPLLLIVFQTSADEMRCITATPESRLLKDVPVYPGSILLHAQENAASRTTLEVYLTEGSLADIRRFYTDTLLHDGWTALPGLSAAPSGAVPLFMKGNRICTVAVSTTPLGRRSITLLHKALDHG